MDAYLVPARTRLETLVCEVELLDAERAGLLLVIVEDERVLYAFRHDVECVARSGRRRVGRAQAKGGVECAVKPV